jgi:membrane protein
LYALMKETFRGWSEHRGLRLGAALAFYTIFAIAPLFIIVLAIAGFVFGEEAARRELFQQLSGLLGQRGGEAIEGIVASADRPKAGAWATVLATITLFIGSTGVFVQLQDSLNTIWQVRRKPGAGLRAFIRDRLLSFAMVLGIGFLLLVSLILSAGLAAMGKFVSGLFPAQQVVWEILNFLVSIGLIAVLFAMMFKVLPDVHLAWRDVWVGAILSSIFFSVGKTALGLYLGRGSVVSAYGAAGSLVVVIMWVYYASQTVFLGAEFTRANAHRLGHAIRPTRGAQFITIKEVHEPNPEIRDPASQSRPEQRPSHA